MCLIGKVAKVAGKVLPFGALGLASSLFGGKKTKTKVINTETYNPRGSYIDPKTGATVLPAEVRQSLAGSTGVAAPSLFAKG